MKDLAECCQSPCEAQSLRIALVGNDKYQYAGDDRGDNQCVESCSAEGCRNRSRTSGYLDSETADSDVFEFFVAIEHGSGHDGGGGKEEVDGQKLAQDAQDLAVVVVGNQP